MNETGFDSRFLPRRERFDHADFVVEILLPRSSEALIDEAEFGADERLPYWAELWPSARALARHLLQGDAWIGPAIELGCGVGLPSLALRHRGVPILATDYYEDALLFARRNAEANGLGPLETRLVDWRLPPSDLGRFPLALAADVLYEARNATALGDLLPSLLAPGGQLLLADPDRVHLPAFLDRMAAADWRIESVGDAFEPSSAGAARQIQVRLFRLSPPPSPRASGAPRPGSG
jgi:predicted nicotinamide N-methyase